MENLVNLATALADIFERLGAGNFLLIAAVIMVGWTVFKGWWWRDDTPSESVKAAIQPMTCRFGDVPDRDITAIKGDLADLREDVRDRLERIERDTTLLVDRTK